MSEKKPDGKTGRPRMSAAERRLLIHADPETREEAVGNMSRAERRRMAREEQKAGDRRGRYAGKVTTRADVVEILELYNERKILPMAQNLDDVMAFVYAPWYRRAAIRWTARWIKVVEWLDRKGIRIVRTDAGGNKHNSETEEEA